MPLPTKSVSAVIRKLKKEKPDMPMKQMVAVALERTKGSKKDKQMSAIKNKIK